MPKASFEASPTPVIGVCGGLGVFHAVLLFGERLQLTHIMPKTSTELRRSFAPPVQGQVSLPPGQEEDHPWVVNVCSRGSHQQPMGASSQASNLGQTGSCHMGAARFRACPSVTGRGGRLVGKQGRLSRTGQGGEEESIYHCSMKAVLPPYPAPQIKD